MNKKKSYRIPAGLVTALLLLALAACSPTSSVITSTENAASTEDVNVIEPAVSVAEPETDTPLNIDMAVPDIAAEIGFDSPEGAAIAFLEGLRDGNLEHMINSFAIETYVKNYDFEASISYNRFYNSSLETKFPNNNQFITSMNIESRQSSVRRLILEHYIYLCDMRLVGIQLTGEMTAAELTVQLTRQLNAPKLNTLQVIGFISPEDFLAQYSEKEYQPDVLESAKRYGANSQTDVIAIFEVDSNRYLQCFNMMEYNGKWCVRELRVVNPYLSDLLFANNGLLPIYLMDQKDKQELEELITPLEPVDSIVDMAITDPVAETGFASSQDAAKAYLEGLRDGDLGRMMDSFAVSTYAEKFDFEESIDFAKGYAPGTDIRIPNANEFVTALNIEKRRSEVSDSIIQQYIYLCDPTTDWTDMIILKSDAAVSKFLRQFNKTINSPKLDTLKIIGFLSSEAIEEIKSEIISNPERHEQNMARLTKIYGADSQESLVPVFELDGQRYLLFLDTIQYGDKWFIFRFGGNIGMLLPSETISYGLVLVPDYDKEEEAEFEAIIVPIE